MSRSESAIEDNTPTFHAPRLLLVLLLAALFSTHAIAAPHRPFVLLNNEELSALRKDLAHPGWKRDLYHAPRGFSTMNSARGVRANADLWLKRAIQIPACGGHFHYFFCVEGDQLELPKDQRFVPGPYRCPKCGREYSGEKYEGALRRVVHGWLARAALDLALVSALEQEPQYAAKSAEILLKYAAAYPGPHTGLTAGGMLYQSLDESMWVIPLAQAYDLVYNQLAPPERAKIEAFLRTVAKGLQSCNAKGNWESWHLSAVGVVGYAIGDQELIHWATRRFQQQIRDELGDDGLWPESVHTYHYFPLMAFMSFAEAAWHAGVDLYHWEGKPGKSLLSMFTAPLAYAYPDLRLPAINDGWFQSFVPADCYELACYRTKDPRFAWVLANGYKRGSVPAGTVPSAARNARRNGFYAFLFGGEIPKAVTPPPAASTNFPVLGICILRSTNGAMMTFDYGPFLGHGQYDKMGITLYANRRLWAADYGTPGYGSAILRWYQSTFAHNTVVVDGKDQQRTRENNVKLWLGGADLEAAQSETQAAYPGVAHTRTVVRLGDCFVVSDRLSSPDVHTYDFYLHAEGKLSLDLPPQDCPSVQATVSWIENLSARNPVPALSGRWAEGKSGLAFWLGGSSSLTPIVGQCPAESASRKIPLLVGRQQGSTVQFVAVLCPYRGRLDFRVERRSHGISIRHGGKTDLLSLPTDGSRPSVARKCVGQ